MSVSAALILGLVLLALNAFFVGAEFAVISARRSAIEPLAKQGNKRAKTTIWAMEHVSLMLACAQLGVTVCSVGLGVLAEPALARLVEPLLEELGVSHSLTHPIAFAVALLTVVYLHVVLGEMVPKNLSVSSPDRAALWFAPPLVFIARGLSPLIVFMNWLANSFVRLAGVEPKDEIVSAFDVEQVQSIYEHSQAEGALIDEQGIMAGAIEFSSHTAKDVMVKLSDLISVTSRVSVSGVEELIAKTGYSRFPLVTDAGELQGYIHLKDLLFASGEQRLQPLDSWRFRAMVDVDVNDEIEAVLRTMQRSGSHLARVNEVAQVVGVVFLEDILEELVGEISRADSGSKLGRNLGAESKKG